MTKTIIIKEWKEAQLLANHTRIDGISYVILDQFINNDHHLVRTIRPLFLSSVINSKKGK